MEVQHVYKKEEPEEEPELKSPDSGETRTPRRALRGRGATRADPAALLSSPDTNGAAGTNAPSVPGSGRVLRDRSTRSVPLWRRKDIAEEQEGGEDEDEDEDEAPRRRKAACPRRRRNPEPVPDSTAPCDESTDGTGARAPGTKRAQNRGRTTSSRAHRGSPRVVCKSEPELENAMDQTVEAAEKKTSGEEDRDRKQDDVPQNEGDSSVNDDPKDGLYKPRAQSEDEEGVSSEEDLPFKDDLNDQSYDPKSERDAPKPRRRAPPRLREKKERAAGAEGEEEGETKGTEGDVEKEVKTEGTEGTDVKQESRDGADPPRKRGRRRKDDKSPRLPKRRKKPPVQYVRCEMEGCGTVLAHPRYLQHHIKYQHLMKKKYVCPHPSCGRLFRLQKQLLRHAKHHTDQRDYICEFCARAFKSSHNLAVHRMIHTGEKPLQCEICGFTCRQKASLNWHMKKHDADATYQFSCTICGKKFEKKDSVVAHKAKSHPEVLIAEALAANAGTLVTTATMPSGQVTQVDVNPGRAPEQDRSSHSMQTPSAGDGQRDLAGGGASSNRTMQTVHFVSAPVSQQQLAVPPLPQIVHMTFAALPSTPRLPLQLPLAINSAPSVSLLPPVSARQAFTADPPPPLPAPPSSRPHPPPCGDRKVDSVLWEGGNIGMGGVWDAAGGAGEAQVVTDSSEEPIQRILM
ncbi:E3 ubiquitin-protein ligase ZFP91 [Trichomycterus rosablanca]|uniref:E3 ubiquitin-protein ligase ZFP91 n=1 Tax=Trichomycterus rosablanca TaxID=2290929 RepID=UPI002F354EE5